MVGHRGDRAARGRAGLGDRDREGRPRAGHEDAARRRPGQGARRRHLARRDPPRRRLSRASRRQGLARSQALKGTLPIGRSSRETGVRGLRCADARGVSRWRRPDTSRCPNEPGGFAAVPVPDGRHRERRTQAGPTPTWPTTLRRSRPTRWAACRSSRRTTVASRSTTWPRERSAEPAPGGVASSPSRPTRRPHRRTTVSLAGRRASRAPQPGPGVRARAGRARHGTARARHGTAPAGPRGVRARRRARPRARRRCWPSRRPRSRPTPRGSTEAEGDENDINLNDLLMHVLDTGASDLHLTSGARPSIRLNGELDAAGGPADPDAAGHPAGALRRPDPEAAGEVRGEPRARLRLQRARAGPGSA